MSNKQTNYENRSKNEVESNVGIYENSSDEESSVCE